METSTLIHLSKIVETHLYKCTNRLCRLVWSVGDSHTGKAREVITTCVCGSKGQAINKRRRELDGRE